MSTVDAIKKLHTSMIDTRRAYEKAEAETKEARLKLFFSSMIALRQKDHRELHHVLTEMGEKPDEDGSFMTAVHRTVIGVRSAVVGIDRGALSAFARGEASILAEYDEALEQSDLHEATADLLRDQKVALGYKIAEMKDLAKN